LTISRVRRIKRRRVNLFPSRNNFLKNFLLKNRRNGSPTNNACPKDLGNARLQLVIALEMLRSNNFLKTMALAPQSLNLSISAKLARNLPLGIIVVTEVLDFLDIQLEVHSLPWVKWVDRSVIIFRLHLCLELVEDFHTITETPDSAIVFRIVLVLDHQNIRHKLHLASKQHYCRMILAKLPI